MKETWIPLIGFEDKYQVSDLGNIKSNKSGRVLSPYKVYKKNKNGTRRKVKLTLVIFKGGKACSVAVHRAVLCSFKPNTNNLLTVDHIDKDPFNNVLSNLRWATKKEQDLNSFKFKKNNSMRKLTMSDVNEMVKRTKKETLSEIGVDYGIHKRYLCFLLRTMHPTY